MITSITTFLCNAFLILCGVLIYSVFSAALYPVINRLVLPELEDPYNGRNETAVVLSVLWFLLPLALFIKWTYIRVAALQKTINQFLEEREKKK
jgi:hypothetical protein